jgi:hypothetical protein
VDRVLAEKKRMKVSFGDLDLDRIKILKLLFEKEDMGMWTGFNWDRTKENRGLVSTSNKFRASRKVQEFLEQLSD